MSNLYISLANVNDLNAFNKKYFHPQKITSFRELAEMTTRSAWSPILWHKGRRCIANYENCRFLVLDYDSGTPTIKQMITTMRMNKLMYFIGTTKSHQIEKVKESGKKEKPCDRFRLVVALSQPLHQEVLRFKWQMVKMMKRWPVADASCKDQGRFFYPCREIVSIEYGRSLKIPDAPTVDKLKEKYDKIAAKKISGAKAGNLPKEIAAFLNQGICSERRPMVFKTASFLYRAGWDENVIKNHILAAPFPKDDLKTGDLVRQINNGIRVNK